MAAVAKPADVQLSVKDGEKEADDMDSQMKSYVKIKEALAVISKAGDEIDRLRDADEKIADEQERKQLMANLDRVMNDTQAFAASAKKLLDQVKAENDEFAKKPDNQNSARSEMRVNLYNATVRKFSAAMQAFNTANANFKHAMQERQKRRLKNLDKTLDDKVIDKLVEEGKSQEVLDTAIISDDLRECIGEIEQRHADVLRLENQVRQVYELFKDLAVLVDVQQDSLDVIEKHIHAAKDYAEKGADHLKKGEEYQATARKRQCCILLIVVAILTVVLAPTLAVVLKSG